MQCVFSTYMYKFNSVVREETDLENKKINYSPSNEETICVTGHTIDETSDI